MTNNLVFSKGMLVKSVPVIPVLLIQHHYISSTLFSPQLCQIQCTRVNSNRFHNDLLSKAYCDMQTRAHFLRCKKCITCKSRYKITKLNTWLQRLNTGCAKWVEIQWESPGAATKERGFQNFEQTGKFWQDQLGCKEVRKAAPALSHNYGALYCQRNYINIEANKQMNDMKKIKSKNIFSASLIQVIHSELDWQ